MRWTRLRNAIKDGSLIGVRGPPGATDRITPCGKKGGKPTTNQKSSEDVEPDEKELQEPNGRTKKGIGKPIKDIKSNEGQSVKDSKTQKRRKVSEASEAASSLPGCDAASATSDDHDKDPDSSKPLVADRGASMSFDDTAQVGQPPTFFTAVLPESIDLG